LVWGGKNKEKNEKGGREGEKGKGEEGRGKIKKHYQKRF